MEMLLLYPIYVWNKESGLIVWFIQGYTFNKYIYQNERKTEYTDAVSSQIRFFFLIIHTKSWKKVKDSYIMEMVSGLVCAHLF